MYATRTVTDVQKDAWEYNASPCGFQIPGILGAAAAQTVENCFGNVITIWRAGTSHTEIILTLV